MVCKSFKHTCTYTHRQSHTAYKYLLLRSRASTNSFVYAYTYTCPTFDFTATRAHQPRHGWFDASVQNERIPFSHNLFLLSFLLIQNDPHKLSAQSKSGGIARQDFYGFSPQSLRTTMGFLRCTVPTCHTTKENNKVLSLNGLHIFQASRSCQIVAGTSRAERPKQQAAG